MDPLTRRRFLVASGVTGAAALAAGAGTVTWQQLADRTRFDPMPGDAKILVLVTLYGGNDSLGTVVPAADPAYQDARPDLAYEESETLPLGDGLSLSPSMRGLHGLWKAKKLAIVRGVGYPEPDRSHFRSMDIWQTASPARPVRTGWIGRWLDTGGRTPLDALSLGATLPPLAVGERVAAGALPANGLTAQGGRIGDALAALAKADAADSPAQALAARGIGDYLRLGRTLQAAEDAAPEPDPSADPEDEEKSGASAGGQGQLGEQLDTVARLVQAGTPTRVYAVSLGGFDTHADERATQERLLGELDKAVTGFLGKMKASDRGRGVVVAVYSEFGRRVAANASDGTDHGTAGVVLVAGDAVRGGFYGDQPSLTKLNDGDLAITTDFRAVYATLLDRVLDADPGAILDGAKDTIGFL